MKKQLTKDLVDDYFKLLYKYPVYIEMFRKFSSWKEFSNMTSEDTYTKALKEVPDESIFDFLYKNYQIFLNAEAEIEKLEADKEYEYPVHGFDFEKNKQYVEQNFMDTSEQIVYYHYLLKEYPQHISNRMRILSERLNDMFLKGNYPNKHVTLINTINIESPDLDLLFPVPPQSFEELIANELKYLNVQLSIEKLEQSSNKSKGGNNQKYKEEIKRLSEIVQMKDKETKMLTLSEAAEYLKISRTTLYRLTKNQTLHYVIIGKRKYIDKQEIESKMELISGRRIKRK